METEQMTLVEQVAIVIADDRMTEGDRRLRAIAAIAAVRRWDVEHPPSEAEQEAFYRVVIGKPSLYTIARGLRAAAEVRAGGEQHG